MRYKYLFRKALTLTGIFLIAWAEVSAQGESNDTEAIRAFPLRRLNYMFTQYVVPTIFADHSSSFVHAQYLGTGQPAGGGEQWLGIRTAQGYRLGDGETGKNLSIVADGYKQYGYGPDGRFELILGLGYGYSGKLMGFHVGALSKLALYDPVDQNLHMRAGGPMIEPWKEPKKGFFDGVDASLDWYAYYKIKGLARFRAIYKQKDNERGELPGQRSQRGGLEVLGMNVKEWFDVDYYRGNKFLLFDTKLSNFIKKDLSVPLENKTFLQKLDGQARLGYSFADNGLAEYSMAGRYDGDRWSYGLDLSKTQFTNGNIGAMVMFNFWRPEEYQVMRIVAFSNYTPLVLEMYSTRAIFLEFRMSL